METDIIIRIKTCLEFFRMEFYMKDIGHLEGSFWTYQRKPTNYIGRSFSTPEDTITDSKQQ